jgi:hypothetical protein
VTKNLSCAGLDGKSVERTRRLEVLADEVSRNVRAALSGDLLALYPMLAS